jgi:hypothetical protein
MLDLIDCWFSQENDDLVSQGTMSYGGSLGKRSRQSSTGEHEEDTTPHGEAYVTATVGSNEDLDYTEEDLMRNQQSRSTGYLGQNSEVQWLRSVQRQTEHTGSELHDPPYGPPGSGQNAIAARSQALHERRNSARDNSRQGSMRHITDSTFYLDSEDLDFEMIVDPSEDPDPDIAERLFDCYLDTVHPSFPLVRSHVHAVLATFTYSYIPKLDTKTI